MSKKWIIEIISGLFIILFLYTSMNKLLAVNSFQFVLGLANPLRPYATLLKWAVPVSEIIVVLLLFVPRTKKIGLYASTLLMIVFTAYVGLMLAFDPHLPCNCGGVIQTMTWPQHLAFNIFFTLLGIMAIWLYKRQTPFSRREKLNIKAA